MQVSGVQAQSWTVDLPTTPSQARGTTGTFKLHLTSKRDNKGELGGTGLTLGQEIPDQGSGWRQTLEIRSATAMG